MLFLGILLPYTPGFGFGIVFETVCISSLFIIAFATA